MISFSITQDPAAMSPVGQLYCQGLLRSAKRLKSREDASGGLVAKLAAEGIRPGALPLTAHDVVFVVDHWFEWRDNEKGISKPFVVMELLLNGTWYRLGARYAVGRVRADSGSWESYHPVWIEEISGPSALARAARQSKLKPQSVPAPINGVDVSEASQVPASAFYQVVEKQQPIYV